MVDAIKKIWLIVFALASSGVFASAAKPSTSITLNTETSLSDIKQFVGDGFFIETILWDLNNSIDVDEARYLFGFKEGDFVTPYALQRGASLLLKKTNSRHLIVSRTPGFIAEELKVCLSEVWTVRSVRIAGMLIGKDRYKNFYVLEPGQEFDEKKHHHSLDKIIEVLKKEGYCDARLAVECTRDEQARSIDIRIAITLGKKFVVGPIRVSLNNNTTLSGNADRVLNKARRFLKRELNKNYYSADILNKTARALKHYLLKLGFGEYAITLQESVDTNKHHVALTVFLELVQKKKILWSGNIFFSDEYIQQRIANFGPSIDAVPATLVVQELLDDYKNHGFWHVTIAITEDSEALCRLYIAEGSRAHIQTVVFSGVHPEREREVKKQFSSLSRAPVYVPMIKQYSDALLYWYAQQGFWDACIRVQEYVPQGNTRYSLNIAIDEGVKSSVVSLRAPGYDDLIHQGPAQRMAQQIEMHGSAGLDGDSIQGQKKWFLDYFKRRGHAHAEVVVDIQKPYAHAAVVWHITPGPLVHFGKTLIRGPRSLPHDIVMRELTYAQGMIWDDKKIYESLLRLRSLGIFSLVHVAPEHEMLQGHEHERTVILTLHPEEPFELRIRAGVGLQNIGKKFVFDQHLTYKLGTTFFAKNPFNRADYFVLDADVSRGQHSMCLEYRLPHVGGSAFNMVVKGYSSQYGYASFAYECSSWYATMRQGMLVGVQAHGDGVDVSLNTGIEWLKTVVPRHNHDYFLRIADAVGFNQDFLGVKVPSLVAEPVCLFDGVDNRLCPKKGLLTMIGAKAMVPLSSRVGHNSMVKIQIEQSLFVPLHHRLIAGFQVRAGHIFHKNFASVPPSERFYMGGAYSVRSYDTDLCPPRIVVSENIGNCNLIPCGAKTMANVVSELRFLWSRAFEVVVIQDFGVLVPDKRLFDATAHWVGGTGFGFRYNTPLGPFRFDMAWKWSPEKSIESTYAWFLRLGHAF